ncbi:hypothetical protein [Bathymodiolus thermophilus thioautotrophic gill symbiont]|uniref:Uncharacterized protein n=1 Tax=Bathymodiolus thermophilus thioautotrophic gill symbiont TaxID=2360 RepID=A0A1J5UJ36_9GAMM|nr:hypothetical protein [Bathymodiolus thermophilus thioautotrophic gill symbiont]OIR24271.1 hypothetical protein BGC33_03115 [Bathymodiolus thermophilus thioautotrophic gill symbiont]
MDTSEEILKIYYKAVVYCSTFISKTYGLSIEEYDKINPTVAQVAKILGNLGSLVEILAVSGDFDDENNKINLMQLGVIMKQIEKAINDDDEVELSILKRSLLKHIS